MAENKWVCLGLLTLLMGKVACVFSKCSLQGTITYPSKREQGTGGKDIIFKKVPGNGREYVIVSREVLGTWSRCFFKT